MKLVKNENEKKADQVTDKEAEEAFFKILKSNRIILKRPSHYCISW